MRNFFLVLLLGAQLCASVKDEKDLLIGVEHTTGDPLVTVAITRDPFNWVMQITKKVAVRKKEAPRLLWSLTGVSATKRGLYALLDNGKETKLARHDEQLDNGWKVTKISEQGITCKHASGCLRELRV